MYKVATFVILISIGLKSIAQEIESSSFDKFDSLYKAKTKDQSLQSNTVDDIYKNVFFHASRYKDAKKGAKVDVYTGYFDIVPQNALIVDRNSFVKVLFKDGSQKEYKHEGVIKTYGRREPATIYMTIKEGDPLMTKPIQAVRFGYNGGVLDFDITSDNFEFVINSIKKLREITFQ
jgi:hypothetical protein